MKQNVLLTGCGMLLGCVLSDVARAETCRSRTALDIHGGGDKTGLRTDEGGGMIVVACKESLLPHCCSSVLPKYLYLLLPRASSE